MDDRQTVLKLEGVCKSYNVGTPIEVEVLHDIDLELRRGEFIALTGPSGSGKSTLLNLIGLLDRPTKGRLVIDGRDTGTLDDTAITKLRGHSIGFVFQYHCLISAFTALENVMMPGMIHGGMAKAELRDRAEELLKEVKLSHRASHRPSELSGGEQQRVALARALTLRPKLLLADEPTGNLDTDNSAQIHELFHDLNLRHGTTMVLVTHNPELSRSLPRVIKMRDGHIESDETQVIVR